MPHRLDARRPDFEARFETFLNLKRAAEAQVEREVAEILERVRERGDSALIEFSARFDRVELSPDTLRVPEAALAEAAAACSEETLSALTFAARRIEDYHRAQIPEDAEYHDSAGLRLGHRWRPVAAAGLYVPGGLAAYPSSVLMNALPAKAAGVERLVMAVPTPEGRLDPLVLAAAQLAGVSEIYRIGGAQAIAALAYGTETIAPVDKIVGPGNAYVAAAKRQVFGTVGIDMIAGPSEILVLADATANPDWIAADLLAQSEHDRTAQAILMTEDSALAVAVEGAIQGHLAGLARREIAGASWEAHGAIILLPDCAAAPALIDRIAPEHLELAVRDPEALAARVRNAGAIFLGHQTPEAIGDYVAGPSHVLPTGRGARYSSGLSVLDFMKRSSLIACDLAGLRAVGPAAVTLARAEGLDAHALSVMLRLDAGRSG